MIKLFKGDCLDAMKDIPDESIDMVLVDPPYGITKNDWDKVIDIDGFWAAINRVTKLNGAILVFSRLPFGADLINANRKNYRYDIVWHKTMPTGFLNANRMPLRAHDQILVFYRKPPIYNPQKFKTKPYSAKRGGTSSVNYSHFKNTLSVSEDGLRFPTDVIKFSNGDNSKTHYHSTQKPTTLLEYLIRTYTNPGDIVLDACMGSGSTGVACINTGRGFIGIEKEPGFYQTARKRITEAMAEKMVAELA